MVDQSQGTVRGSRPRPGAVLAVLSVAAFMASLDLFIVNVAFDDIGRDFHGVSLSDLSWVLNGYAIVYAALLVPLGRLADRFGRKPGFLLGLGDLHRGQPRLRAVGRPLDARRLPDPAGGRRGAADPDQPRAARERHAARGDGCGPCGSGPRPGALAAAVGPAVGGVLVEASWRWVFLVNLPIGIAALVVRRRAWCPTRGTTRSGRIPDLLGAGRARRRRSARWPSAS